MLGNIKENMLSSSPRNNILDPLSTFELSSSSKIFGIQEKSHIYLCQDQTTCLASLISCHQVTNYMRYDYTCCSTWISSQWLQNKN